MEHQTRVLEETARHNRVAYYLDMGLGKTFVGSEKMDRLGEDRNLIICQKSKIKDWCEHMRTYYDVIVLDLTHRRSLDCFMEWSEQWLVFDKPLVGIINYELAWRRPELNRLKDFTLMLDESSLISNERTKRSRFILNLKAKNVVLLSGTPTAGKYEQLWSQCKLLGWNISKTAFWNSYVVTKLMNFGGQYVKVVDGYKNVEHLKQRLAMNGAVFMKTEEVLTLPDQNVVYIYSERTKEYKKFLKERYLKLKDGTELVGDNSLTKMLHARQLCGVYHKEKLEQFRDILQSTEDRLVVFYNFQAECDLLLDICKSENKPVSIVNGKKRDTTEYDTKDNAVLLVQYQAGAMGGNYQKGNKIVYFTLPLGKGSCDLWEQSKKRIHRIGQSRPCFYYYLLVNDTVEIKNLEALNLGKDLTDALFE